jgi:hypothetical protein
MPDFRGEAAADLVDCIEAFYNWSRRRFALGHKSPTRFLQHWI